MKDDINDYTSLPANLACSAPTAAVRRLILTVIATSVDQTTSIFAQRVMHEESAAKMYRYCVRLKLVRRRILLRKKDTQSLIDLPSFYLQENQSVGTRSFDRGGCRSNITDSDAASLYRSIRLKAVRYQNKYMHAEETS